MSHWLDLMKRKRPKGQFCVFSAQVSNLWQNARIYLLRHCLAQCIVCHTNGHQRRGALAMPHPLPIQHTFRTRPQQAVSRVKVGPRKPSTCAKREPVQQLGCTLQTP